MQNVYPPDRVLIAESLPTRYRISKVAPYIDIFTEKERNAIIAKYKTPNLFNGTSVRLDSIEDGLCSFSVVMFYDFLCCNIAGFHNKDVLSWPKLEKAICKYGKLNSFEKVLGIRELPNLICTSTLLHDINGEYLLIERNTKVSIGSGLFACTSSGSMTIEDCQTSNPIVSCAQRELIEELNLNVNLYVQGIIMPLQKMQPVALLTGQVQRPWREILSQMKQGVDYEKENSRTLVVPKSKLLSIISMYKFTDAASFHIFFEAGGNKELWHSVDGQFINVNDFYV